MEVYLIRHTAVQTDSGLCYGQTDLPLKEDFLSDFKKIREKLPSTYDKIYSSDLQRCRQLAEYLGSEIELRKELREMDFGDWEAKFWNDIPKEEAEDWMENFVEEKTPHGESMVELFMRVSQFIDELRNKNFKKVIIVSHAGVIRCVLGYLLEIPLENLFKIQVDFGQVVPMELDSDRRMDLIRWK